jgi:hypothetical protein
VNKFVVMLYDESSDSWHYLTSKDTYDKAFEAKSKGLQYNNITEAKIFIEYSE